MRCDIFDLPDVGHFSCALSSPPFGRTTRSGRSLRYQGKRFEYHVIDMASDLADHGVFLIPQESTPFRYSDKPEFSQVPEDRIPEYREFRRRSHIEFDMNCGVDTSQYRGDWDGVARTTEIVITDFNAVRDRRVVGMTAELFARTA